MEPDLYEAREVLWGGRAQDPSLDPSDRPLCGRQAGLETESQTTVAIGLREPCCDAEGVVLISGATSLSKAKAPQPSKDLDDHGRARGDLPSVEGPKMDAPTEVLAIEQSTGFKGRYVKVADTVKGFKMLCQGDLDHLPEQAFLYVGTIEEAIEKAEKMKAEG